MKIRITLLAGNFEDREIMRKWADFLKERGHTVDIQENISGWGPPPSAIDEFTAESDDAAALELQALTYEFDQLV
jgi:hypothetical protein